jgi:hypothetical protein
VDQSFNGYPINAYKTAQDKYILNDRIQLISDVIPFPEPIAPVKKNKIDRLLHKLGLKKD